MNCLYDAQIPKENSLYTIGFLAEGKGYKYVYRSGNKTLAKKTIHVYSFTTFNTSFIVSSKGKNI